ncbi:MAG TPA: hypothetical protein VIE65_19815 [Methylobacter sp.]|jgi:predicted DNA-binding transcriptional regulator AlpA
MATTVLSKLASPDDLVSASTVAAEFDVGRRTIGRRILQDPDFPRPIRLKGRLYWRRADIDSYKAALLREAMEGAA